jgi:nicotinamidase-related amidase
MKFDRILLDIDSQRDFFLPGGSCYKRPARRVLANIRRLFSWVRRNRLPVISTALRVRPNEIGPLCDTPHCVEGTEGEQKVPRTLLPGSVDLGMRNSTDLPRHLLETHPQVIFEMRNTDLFGHARAERLITELEPTTVVVCGAGLAHGIVEASVGLRSRGFDVIAASDAMLTVHADAAEMALKRMEAKGVEFVETDEVCRYKRPRRRYRPEPLPV